MGKLTKFAAGLESAANLAESRAIKRSHKARHGAAADADALALERRLLENMWQELAATEKFFRDAVHPRSTLHSFAMCTGMLTEGVYGRDMGRGNSREGGGGGGLRGLKRRGGGWRSGGEGGGV